MEIAFSRQVRYYQTFQFFYGLSLLLFTQFAYKTLFDAALLICGVIVLCLCMLTTFSSILLIPAIIMGIIIIDYQKLFSFLALLKKKKFISLLLVVCLTLFFITNDVVKALIIIKNNYSNHVKDYIALYLKYLPLTFSFSIYGLVMFFKKRNVMFLCSVLIYYLVAFFLWNAVWYRFLYHITLFLIVGSLYLLFFVSRLTRYRQNVWYGVGLVVFLLTLSTVSAEVTLLPQINYRSTDPHANFRRAYESIKTTIKPTDVVVSITTGIVPSYYYLGEGFIKEKNFCLTYKISEQEAFYRLYLKNGQWYEDYTGCKIVTDFSQLFDILKRNKRGWIVWDQQKLYHIDNDTRRLLETIQYLEDASDETIKVYFWNFEDVREIKDENLYKEDVFFTTVKLSEKTIFQVNNLQMDEESKHIYLTILLRYLDPLSEDTTYYILKPQLASESNNFVLKDYLLPLPFSPSGDVAYQYTLKIPLPDHLRHGIYSFDSDIIKETIGYPPERLSAVLHNTPLFINYLGSTHDFVHGVQAMRTSKKPILFDETTSGVKVIDQMDDLRVIHLKDLPLSREGLDSLKEYDVVVVDSTVSEQERRLLDEYVETGGIVIENRNEPREKNVWELKGGEVR